MNFNSFVKFLWIFMNLTRELFLGISISYRLKFRNKENNIEYFISWQCLKQARHQFPMEPKDFFFNLHHLFKPEYEQWETLLHIKMARVSSAILIANFWYWLFLCLQILILKRKYLYQIKLNKYIVVLYLMTYSFYVFKEDKKLFNQHSRY